MDLEKGSIGVVKFDCLTSFDKLSYQEAGVPVQIGFSGKFCPDHYYVSNIEDAVQWGLAWNSKCLLRRAPVCVTAVLRISMEFLPYVSLIICRESTPRAK